MEAPTPTPAPAGTTLRCVHFNDVYHVGAREKEPVGGAARFAAAVHAAQADAVFFSGDVFNPSLESTVTKGHHFIPILNHLGITAACYGNHDFDFGEDVLTELASECNFPWLLSNVRIGTDPPARGKRTVVVELCGIRVGLMGLAEPEWLDALPQPPEGIEFDDFVETARLLEAELRTEHQCRLVVALTHMRLPNDIVLAQEVPQLDLILGGHDHFYRVLVENGVQIVKSGMDFRDFSLVTITVPADAACKPAFDVVRHTINGPMAEDAEVAKMVGAVEKLVEKDLNNVVGATEVVLDARVEAVRTRESALGNLTCGALRSRYGADVAIICGGTFRSGQSYGPGDITAKDINNIFPFQDTSVVLEVPGNVLLAALENGVSLWPKHDGRFPQVSGMRFVFDPARPAGSRVVSVTVGEDRVPLDPAKLYKLATRAYLYHGRDGYECLEGARVLLDEEIGSTLNVIMMLVFRKAEIVSAWKRRFRIVQSAIAAFRGAKNRQAQKCISVCPKVDGRIQILGQGAAGATKGEGTEAMTQTVFPPDKTMAPVSAAVEAEDVLPDLDAPITMPRKKRRVSDMSTSSN